MDVGENTNKSGHIILLLLTILPDVVNLCLEPRQKSETFDPAEDLISF